MNPGSLAPEALLTNRLVSGEVRLCELCTCVCIQENRGVGRAGTFIKETPHPILQTPMSVLCPGVAGADGRERPSLPAHLQLQGGWEETARSMG